MRRSLSKVQRLRIFEAHKGICHLCNLKIHAERGEQWDVSHIKSLWLDGEDAEHNMAPAHRKDCHAGKTKEEAPIKAKVFRMRARHLGIRKQSRFPGSRDSGLRKKLNGEVVRRV